MLALVPPRSRPRHVPLNTPILAILSAAMVLLAPAVPLHADRGGWTPLESLLELDGVAVHLALVPGDGVSHHSHLVWWGERKTGTKYGGVWGWQPGHAGCASLPDPGPPLTELATWTLETPTPVGPNGKNLFCGGAATLGSGQLFAMGGNDGINFQVGIRDALTYTAGTSGGSGTWVVRDKGKDSRWYPTVTALRDGRALVTGGHKYRHMWLWGGRRYGAAPGDLLERFGRLSEGAWDPALTPEGLGGGPTRPTPREGHALVYMADPAIKGQLLIGGKDGSGSQIGDPAGKLWYLRREATDPFALEYRYQWHQLDVTAVGDPPEPRSDHVALVLSETEILVFGGVKKPAGGPAEPTDEFWRLYKDGTDWTWERVSSGTLPSARYAHGAVLDFVPPLPGEAPAPPHRLLVFGGAGASGEPTDNSVHVFTFTTPGTAAAGGTWSTLSLSGPLPAARMEHTMAITTDPAGNPGRAVWMLGGRLNGGAADASLWKLRVDRVGGDRWEEKTPADFPGGPSARAGHVGVWDGVLQRLWFFGGVHPTTGAATDKVVYRLDPVGPAWSAAETAPDHLTGHAWALEPPGGAQDQVWSRFPEIFDPEEAAGSQWRSEPAASWLQGYYPAQFLVPGTTIPGGGGRVLTMAPEVRTLDIPHRGTAITTTWQPYAGGVGFQPHSAVQYLPGKIMGAGGVAGGQPHGTTKTLDYSAGGSWVNRPAMLPRDYHNLVLLPTGEVLALGGMKTFTDPDKPSHDIYPPHAQLRPEIWNPATGAWTGESDPAVRLAPDAIVRNYHSTAVLLPCGRVVSAGGWGPGDHDGDSRTGEVEHPDMTTARLFCPPYLFKADGSPIADAERPQVQSAPPSVTWGQRFTLCVADTTGIRSAALIRPGATTHHFDQNQRYVPLTIHGHAGGPQRLFVSAPASPDSAPPGDYLLFVTGAVVGGTHYPDLPSIAKWVRLETPTGADLCDVVAPGTPELVPDILGPTEIWLAWEAPGDDAEIIPSGAAVGYDLRQGLSPISTETAWNAATPATGPDPLPVPWPHPTGQTFGVTGLAECTSYSFALRATDDHAAISLLQSPAFTVSTTCGGAGGGTSARRTRDEEGARTYSGSGPAESRSGAAPGVFSGGRVAQAASSELQRTPGALVAETRRVDERTWRITLRLATQADGLDLTGSDVTVEREADEGGHERLARHAPGAGENLLGLAALRERGRVAIRSFVRLDRVVPRFQRRGRDLALIEAHHSRLGSLGPAFVAEGGHPELSDGDRIELTYAEAGEATSGSPAWYLLLHREGGAAPIPFSQRRDPGEALPVRFALHPGEPNPTAGVTSIRFDLPVESHVRLAVFDLLGRRVVPLTEGVMPAGSHRVQWDLRDASGARVRPGVYVYRLTAGSFRARGKVSVVP